MFSNILALVTFLFIIRQRVYCFQTDYYWKEYTGVIPEDAYIAGKDVNNKNIYIGQAYYKDVGLLVVEIFAGNNEVVIPINRKMVKVQNHIKILCGSKFYWFPSSPTELHLKLFDRQAVIGGHIDGYGQINIGRINHKGKTKIGRILSYSLGSAYFYFNDDGKEGDNTESYEVLIDNNNEVTFDVRMTDATEGYYWREYTGSIPPDAVVGGKDINGYNVYIGQAYDKNLGLIPVQIYSGEKEVVVAIYQKIKKLKSFIKILCGHQSNFYWLPTNISNFHLSLHGKHAVVGGHVDGYTDMNGLLNIGRISYQGETKIGRILTFWTGNEGFYFYNDGKEGIDVKSYEILIYDDNNLDGKNKIPQLYK